MFAAGGLNFWVRNGIRWDPAAKDTPKLGSERIFSRPSTSDLIRSPHGRLVHSGSLIRSSIESRVNLLTPIALPFTRVALSKVRMILIHFVNLEASTGTQSSFNEVIECLGYVFNSHLHGSLRERLLIKFLDVVLNSTRQDLWISKIDLEIDLISLRSLSLYLNRLITQKALNREE